MQGIKVRISSLIVAVISLLSRKLNENEVKIKIAYLAKFFALVVW